MEVKNLLHYTSSYGLLGIIENNELWASDYRFLNDPDEAMYGCDLLQDFFQSRLSGYINNGNLKFDEGKLSDLFQKKKISGMDEFIIREADTLKLAFGNYILNRTSLYVSSLSNHAEADDRENGSLPLWRHYGLDGGYAVEFDAKRLELCMKEEYNKYNYGGWKMGRVFYGGFENYPVSDDFDQNYLDFLTLMQGASESDEIRNKINFLVNFSFGMMTFLKSGYYRTEEEYRLSFGVYDDIKSEVLHGTFRPSKEVKYRPKGGAVIPYIKVFGGGENLPITRVIVGPHLGQGRRADSVAGLLRKNNINAEVQISKIPVSEIHS